jgi:glyceraldehyde 3-phosphate dehydrogenase
MEIVAVNDLTDTKTLAYLLKHDSNYGTYDKEVGSDDKNIIVDGQKIAVLAEKDPAVLPWKDMQIDVVIESTGRFTDKEGASKHIQAGAKRVVISGPTKSDGVDTIVLGANDDKLKNSTEVISNASCTTNSLGAVMAILEAEFGVEKSLLTTVHSYTASHSGTVDLLLTKVVGGNLAKVMIWYDNEWGYSNRLVEVVADTGKNLQK